MSFRVGVLLIDSNRDSIATTTGFLRDIGMQNVYPVKDLASAMNFIENDTALFIVLDSSIGAEDSLKFVKWLRSNFKNRNYQTPIIMAMTNPTKQNVTAARDAGVSEFLLKPFSPELIKKMVFAVLDKPRNFIISRGYVGPDRRRKFALPPDGKKKRKDDH